MEEVELKIGKSIYFTHLFTELVKGRREDQTLSELLELKDPVFL